jgi:hypothetical protein
VKSIVAAIRMGSNALRIQTVVRLEIDIAGVQSAELFWLKTAEAGLGYDGNEGSFSACNCLIGEGSDNRSDQTIGV